MHTKNAKKKKRDQLGAVLVEDGLLAAVDESDEKVEGVSRGHIQTYRES